MSSSSEEPGSTSRLSVRMRGSRWKSFLSKRSPKRKKQQREPTFTIFPELPLELRLLIWKSALPGPRVVEIFDTEWDIFAPAIAKSSMSPLLPLLRTCRDSHRVVCEEYRKIYADSFRLRGMEAESAFYVNHETDAIFFRTRFRSIGLILNFSDTAEKLAIKTIILMLEPLAMKIFEDGLNGLPRNLSELENLREVVLAARVPASTFDPKRKAVLDYRKISRENPYTFYERPNSHLPQFEQRVQAVITRILAPWQKKSRPIVDIVTADLLLKD